MNGTRYSLKYIEKTTPFYIENKSIELWNITIGFIKNKNLANWDGEELDYKNIIELKRIKNRSKITAFFYRFLLRCKL